jgi:transposase
MRPCIRFLNGRNLKLADIHRRICEVYDVNAMSGGMVRKLARQFKEGRDNLHEEPRSGRPSVITGGQILRGGNTETGAPL